MRGGAVRFFGACGPDLLDRYFECARFWNDIDYVMGLTVTDLILHLDQARRIAKIESRS